MPDKTAAARNARLRARKRAVGLITVTVTIPEERKPELDSIVRQWRAQEPTHPDVVEP
jgi:hypothetical protein